ADFAHALGVGGQLAGHVLLVLRLGEPGEGHRAVERVDVDGHAAGALVFQQLRLDGGADLAVLDVLAGRGLAPPDGAAAGGEHGTGEDGQGDGSVLEHGDSLPVSGCLWLARRAWSAPGMHHTAAIAAVTPDVADPFGSPPLTSRP